MSATAEVLRTKSGAGRTYWPNAIASMVVVLALAAAAAGISAVRAQQHAAPTRTVLQKHDLQAQGEEGVMVLVDIPVGAREGRHTHPAEVFVYVLEGTLTLDKEGEPSASYKAGETFFVERGIVHEGRNGGSTPVKAVAVFVTDKGKPMTTQVQ
jgi:quercetin dioxygenase-like cupin family protein